MQAREPITSDHTCTVIPTLRKSQSCALRTKYSHQTNIKFDELYSLIYKYNNKSSVASMCFHQINIKFDELL